MKKFPYHLYSIPTLEDGSCFLHAILYAISPYYRKLEKRKKISFARKLRDDLADVLPEYYPDLSRGELKNLSKEIKETKLAKMQDFLRSSQWFNQLYLEFISNIFEIDIYIIDYKRNNLYNTGDRELLYKDRPSVIIGYQDENHFETLAAKDLEGEKRTYFSPKSDIILKMKFLLFK
jgi:hypothetical protein